MHPGVEDGDSTLLGRLREVREQDRAQAAAVVGVRDREGDLGTVARSALVGAVADDALLVTDADQQPVDILVVDGGSPPCRPLEIGAGREEPEGTGLDGEALEEGEQRGFILRGDGTHVRGRAIAQGDIDLPSSRVGSPSGTGSRRHAATVWCPGAGAIRGDRGAPSVVRPDAPRHGSYVDAM